MKPAPFAYEAPTSLDAALALVADEESRPLAGGQSLIPMMNFRLAYPERLIDLNPVAELACLHEDGEVLRIGAMVRQATLQRSEAVAGRWPLLAEAVAHVGHAATRSRGTIGGSVAHADPAAELPVALTALDARFRARSASGERTLGAVELFAGALTTTLRGDELLVEIEVPPPPPGARMAFAEQARTHGDFASAGVAVVVAPGRSAAIALLGAGPVPVRASGAERALLDGAAVAEAAGLVGAEVADDHRRAVLRALTRRALERALT